MNELFGPETLDCSFHVAGIHKTAPEDLVGGMQGMRGTKCSKALRAGFSTESKGNSVVKPQVLSA